MASFLSQVKIFICMDLSIFRAVNVRFKYRSAVLYSLINIRVSIQYTYMELSEYLSVKCIAFIVCVFGSIILLNILQLHSFTQTKQLALDFMVCFSIHRISRRPSHPVTQDYSLASPLSSSVVWGPVATSLPHSLIKSFCQAGFSYHPTSISPALLRNL